MRNAIILFVRAPSAGQAKTRLIGSMSAEKVTALYEAFVKDTVEKAGSVKSVDLFVSFTPVAHAREIAGLAANATGYFPQMDGDLGERMLKAFRYVFSLGYERVLLVGTDLPTLPSSTFNEAFRAFDEVDIVLGPSDDGGYYLIGMKNAWADLFAGIEWSTDRVLEQTIRKAASNSLSMKLLKAWYDVDTPADIERLRQDLVKMKLAGIDELPAHTFAELFGDRIG